MLVFPSELLAEKTKLLFLYEMKRNPPIALNIMFFALINNAIERAAGADIPVCVRHKMYAPSEIPNPFIENGIAEITIIMGTKTRRLKKLREISSAQATMYTLTMARKLNNTESNKE